MVVLLSRAIGEIVGLGLVYGPHVIGKVLSVTSQTLVLEMHNPGPNGLTVYIPVDKIIGFAILDYYAP